MSVAPKQVGLVVPINDMATGGAVALPVGLRIEQLRALTIGQTTAAQTISLPNPVDTSIVFGLQVSNTGSVSFVMYNVTLAPGTNGTYYWNGAAWGPDATPHAVNAVVEHLVPSGVNTVPALASARRTGTAAKVYVNGVLVSAGITVDLPGAVTVDPVALGYGVAPTDIVSVEYYV